MKVRILSLILLCCGMQVFAHPVHMSITNIDIHTDSNNVDVAIGLFYSDLQALINYKYNTLIEFDKNVSMTTIEQRSILEYVSSNFVISGEKVIDLQNNFLRWKIEDEMIWLFFCGKLQSNASELNIGNKLFFELYSDQVNFTVIQHDGKEEGIEFTRRYTSHNFKFR